VVSNSPQVKTTTTVVANKVKPKSDKPSGNIVLMGKSIKQT